MPLPAPPRRLWLWTTESGACEGQGALRACLRVGLVGSGLGEWLGMGCCGEVLPLLGRCTWCWGSSGADGGDGPKWLTLPLPRLLHSLTNLKHVIINAAHYLVLGDKDTYHHDPAAPFLGMVSSTSPWLPALWHAVPIPPEATPCCRGQEKGLSLCPCPWAQLAGGLSTPQLFTTPPQDETRSSQDSLPERTVIKLDTSPR